jgi:pimeloyl-ACP methyl ester carboxylesterase
MTAEALRAPPEPPYRTDVLELHDGRALGFCEFGDPSGAAVLWFHGTPGARQQIPPDAPAYAERVGVRLVVPERGGVGQSTVDFDRTLLSWAEDVHQLVDALEIERFGLAGLSGGGPHVLAVAHQLPDRVTGGALLGSMVPMTGPDAPASLPDLMPAAFAIVRALRRPLGSVMSAMFKRIEPDDVDKIFPLVMKVLPDNDREVVDTPGFRTMFVEDLYQGSRDQFYAQMIDLAAITGTWGFSPRDVSVPIRSWHGTSDLMVPVPHAEHLVDLLPDAQLEVFEGDGHFAGYTRAPDVLDWLLERAEVRGS